MPAPHPRAFFTDYACRSVHEFTLNPADEYHAKRAAQEVNNLAERFFTYWHPIDAHLVYSTPHVRAFRTHIRDHLCTEFGIVWDVAEAHKHVYLTRTGRVVTSATQSRVQAFPGVLGGPLGGPFSPHDAVVVDLDDGRTVEFLMMVQQALTFWHRIMASTP